MKAAPPLKGLVLAGGQSSRMGKDKADLRIGSATLLEHAVHSLSSVVTEVYVSARAEQAGEGSRARFVLIPDQVADIGPAAGLLAAHAHDPEAAWLILAVDMPLVDAALLGELAGARDPALAATAWRSSGDGRPEPLCTIYEPATLAAFAHNVAEGGSTSPRSWLYGVSVKMLEPPTSNVLANANTSAQFESLAASARTYNPDRKANG